MTNGTDYYDEHGHGPMTREYFRVTRRDPATCQAGYQSFASAVEHAIRKRDGEFPEQFRKMLLTVTLEILASELPAMVKEMVRIELEPVRKAYVELKAARGI